MEEVSSFFTYIMNSEEIIQTGGLLAILLIVYIENGLFFGFFLPGDYLLFLTGVFVSSQHLEQPILLVLLGVFAAGVLGSYTGYISGRFFGDKIRNKKDSLFFKQKYLTRTANYFEKYGNRTLIIARFLPIVRTFAPILAGLVRMNFVQFRISYNSASIISWGGPYGCSRSLAGATCSETASLLLSITCITSLCSSWQ